MDAVRDLNSKNPAPKGQGVDQALQVAQIRSLAAHMPFLYALLCINSTILAYTHFDKAPWAVVLSEPALIILCGLWRLPSWAVRRHGEIDPNKAGRQLAVSTTLLALFGASFLTWSVVLYGYGDAQLHGQIIFAMATTVIGAVFCMTHLPLAALLLGGVTFPAFSLFLFMTGEMTAAAIGLNLLLASIGMLYLIDESARGFADLVQAQAETERLSAINSALANTDNLTGLPNRREFFARLERLVQRDSGKERFVVGLIDLDGFKPVNDLYGHVVGDRVLVECARRIETFADKDAFFARLGGDEFGLIFQGEVCEEAIHEFGARVCAALKAPFEFEDVIATISASIGCIAFPEGGTEVQQLYERADYALYFAKQNKRGETSMFSPEHESKMRRLAMIEQALRKADLENELSVHYQPLFNVADNTIASFEALARWNSPDMGMVSPDLFIAVAERSDIIYAVTRTLLRKALKEAENWPEHIGLSFNLSTRDIISPHAALQIIAIIESSKVDPKRIDLEVTETALMTDFEQALHSIQLFKQTGAKIALDDFGTGYSSLSYVHRLPLDKIKIDRSFVVEMAGNPVARNIVKTLIGLCANLQLGCVTEGVETQEQYAELKGYGCTYVQGYLFSRPLPQADVKGFVEAHQIASRRVLASRQAG